MIMILILRRRPAVENAAERRGHGEAASARAIREIRTSEPVLIEAIFYRCERAMRERRAYRAASDGASAIST